MVLKYDDQWRQWQKDMKRIYKETVVVFENRLIFREILKMFEKNPALRAEGGFVWEWLRGTYGRDMVIAVGRELDRSTEVVNLIQLMYQMTKRPRVVSRKRYFETLKLKAPTAAERAEWPPRLEVNLYDLNQKWFSLEIGAGDYLDPALIKKDRNWLEKRCRTVMKYRHKMVAHRSSIELTVTIKQIHDSLDAIEKVLKKYHTLFAGSSLSGAEPAIQFHWTRPFEIPWAYWPIHPNVDQRPS